MKKIKTKITYRRAQNLIRAAVGDSIVVEELYKRRFGWKTVSVRDFLGWLYSVRTMDVWSKMSLSHEIMMYALPVGSRAWDWWTNKNNTIHLGDYSRERDALRTFKKMDLQVLSIV